MTFHTYVLIHSMKATWVLFAWRKEMSGKGIGGKRIQWGRECSNSQFHVYIHVYTYMCT